MQRLMRAAIGTHNIDNCSRVCHSPTSFALRKSLGLSGATGSFDDIEAADAADAHRRQPDRGPPVVGARIKQAALRGMQLVTIDPRRIELADYGVLHLAPRPGTNAAVMLGLAHVVIRDGLVDHAFVAARTEGFEDVADAARRLHARRRSSAITGVPAADLERAAHIYARGERGVDPLGPRRHRAPVRLRGRAADLQPRADDRQRRPAAARRCCRCAGRTTSRARPTWARCPTPSPPTASVADERRRARVRASAGASTMKREKGLTIPQMFDAAVAGDAEGDVHLRRGRRADRPEHDARRARRSSRSSSSSARTSSRTRRRSSPTCPAGLVVPREDRARSRTPSAAIQLVARGDRPARRGARPTSTSSPTLSRALGHEHGLRDARGRDGRDRRADAATSPASPTSASAARGLQWPVAADGTDAPILYARRVRAARRRARSFAALPYKAPGERGRRRVPAHPRHRPPPRSTTTPAR